MKELWDLGSSGANNSAEFGDIRKKESEQVADEPKSPCELALNRSSAAAAWYGIW